MKQLCKGKLCMCTILGIYLHLVNREKKRMREDFADCPVVKNPPSKAGDASSVPGRGTKIPQALQ